MVSQVTDKLKELQLKMVRYAESKRTALPNGSGYILPDDWSEDFKWVLRLERKPKLSIADKRQCNKLFRKYLGYV
tara:strand:- start:331 stop:555 length:225 start_codon:yes stop_codon:yes gene_type:complete